MPKIYEYFGLVFLFYASDRGHPVHIHAEYGNESSKLEFVYKNGTLIDVLIKRTTGHPPLKPVQMKEAIRFCKKYERDINDKWQEFFGRNKRPEFKRITKKI